MCRIQMPCFSLGKFLRPYQKLVPRPLIIDQSDCNIVVIAHLRYCDFVRHLCATLSYVRHVRHFGAHFHTSISRTFHDILF